MEDKFRTQRFSNLEFSGEKFIIELQEKSQLPLKK